MNYRALLPAGVAAAGLAAVVVGIHTELLHFRPMYDSTIVTGWGRDLNHEERLLARLSGLALVGALASARWRRAAVLPLAVGGIVLFYVGRAVSYYLTPELYTGLPVAGGTTGRRVFGAEPYLLALGALLFVGAAVLGYRQAGLSATGPDPDHDATEQSVGTGTDPSQ
ncbi:hypothetical protein [Halorientalis litorea]|jgi:hypothetical protein|uniref:hypothetical protein n=1 Tax=Halorientalis litorea TaxID=2931977 RepID=UPI001FF1EEF9|nr:hypothetical protein [Halorientalis litorea]